MQNLIQWLESVEQSAADLYSRAAVAFAGDDALAGFLRQLAREETWHLELLRSAETSLDLQGGKDSLITIDAQTRQNITGLFDHALQQLKSGKATPRQMLETIVAAEFSEWNEIFLYALNSLKGSGSEFMTAVLEIERHKEQIENFLRSMPDGERYLEAVQLLPSVWGKKILLIEEQPATAKLLQAILGTIGEVKLAQDGAEGLERLSHEKFDVVVSDINMPAMDSLEFYQSAIGIDPAMRDRFVFFAGAPVPGQAPLPGGDSATRLNKPEMLNQIRTAIAGVAFRNRVFH